MKEPLRLSTSEDIQPGSSAAVYVENGQIHNIFVSTDPQEQCFILPIARALANGGKEAYIVVNPADLEGVQFPDNLYTEDE